MLQSEAMVAQQRAKLPLPTSKHNYVAVIILQLLYLFFRALLDYIGGLVDQRLKKPEDDLISTLIEEQVRFIFYTSIASWLTLCYFIAKAWTSREIRCCTNGISYARSRKCYYGQYDKSSIKTFES
jgi:hypothetical protein